MESSGASAKPPLLPLKSGRNGALELGPSPALLWKDIEAESDSESTT